MLIRSFTYSLLTKLGIACINLCILVLSSHYLGVASRGEISIFLLNLMLMQILNDIYTGFGIIHFIPKYNWRSLVITGLIYTVFNTALCNALLYPTGLQIAGYEWYSYLLSLLVMLNTFACSLLLGKQNISAFNVLSILQPLLLLLGILYCVFLQHQFTFQAYFYPLLFSFLVSFVFAGLFLLWKYPLSSDAGHFSFASIFKNGLVYQVGVWMLIFSNRFSYYLLHENVRVGLYASASALAESVFIISSGLSPVLLSRIANNRLKESGATILSAAKAAAGASLIIVTGLCLLPESFFLWVLGPGFKGILLPLRIYAPGVVLLVFANVLSNFFVANGQQKPAFWAYCSGFVFSLLLAPLLVNHYGVAGAALNALIAYAGIAIFITIAFLRQNGMGKANLFGITADYQLIKKFFLEYNSRGGSASGMASRSRLN